MVDAMTADTLAQAVQANRKYERIMPNLVSRLSQESLRKGLQGKAAIKDVRSKLHQIGGAYFKRSVDFLNLTREIDLLPADWHSPEVQTFCREQMRLHASTAERLPILEEFFQVCLAPIGPVSSVLDLACGLNPLAIPWMPLADDFTYTACDIYLDMLDFIHAFFTHFEIDGKAFPCDLVSALPQEIAQVALLLKTIPCLEQIDKGIGTALLDGIRADHILVSFPAQSLGGRHKGMPDFYRGHFYDLIQDRPWQVREFSFPTEIAFLVSK